MKKFLMCCAMMAAVSGAAMAQYQLENPGFEEWDNLDSDGEETDKSEPINWNSFMNASGKWAATVKADQLSRTTDTRPGSLGNYSVKISARDVFLAIAQGNLTTGCINGGSMSASDASGNYNYTNTSDDNFNQKISGLPDAFRLWVKFNTTSSYKGKVSALLHSNGYYQDPYYNQNGITNTTLIAEAIKSDIESNNTWTEIIIPFDYKVIDGTRPYFALVSLNTSNTAGKGDKNDYLFADDLEFIYYSELASASYDGETITFDASGNANISDFYEKGKLSYVKKGVGAIVETDYNEEEAILTIIVKGDDFASTNNHHTYTIQFAKKGDVNGDGEVTIADVTALVNIILGKNDKKAIADVNGDDDVTIADVTALVNIILGK